MKEELIYWDSDCFLAHLNNEPFKADQCAGTIKRMEAGEVILVTSTFSLVEVLWLRRDGELIKEENELVTSVFDNFRVRLHNLSRKIAKDAQSLIFSHDVPPEDAVHLATALDLNVNALETFDKKFLSMNNKPTFNSLTIREPIAPSQGELDLPNN